MHTQSLRGRPEMETAAIKQPQLEESRDLGLSNLAEQSDLAEQELSLRHVHKVSLTFVPTVPSAFASSSYPLTHPALLIQYGEFLFKLRA